MNPRVLAFLLIASLAACTQSTNTGPTGRLLVVEPDGDLVTMLPDGTDPLIIAPAQAGLTRFQPVWSPQTERIAWGELDGDSASMVVVDGDGGNRLSVPTTSLPYYLYWAPDGERLVGLYNGARGVEARYVESGSGASEILGSAVPYFFSWSPDSTRLVANRNGRTLDIVDLDGTTTDFDIGSLSYQAPSWTDAGIFHLISSGLALSNGATRTIADVTGPVVFVANTEGSLVAVLGFSDQPSDLEVAFQSVPDLRPNVVHVVDVATGETTVAASEEATGMFWSPDGEALAMLLPGQTSGELRWRIWRSAATTDLATFAPEPSFVRDVLGFASQYAQSLAVWSPDSSAIAFAGSVDGSRGIWVQRADGSAPVQVAEGTWVTWSR